MTRLNRHIALVQACRREGHPGFRTEREVHVVGGKPYAFRVCTRCGTGIDPVPTIEGKAAGR